jgi:putative flippase GtrA
MEAGRFTIVAVVGLAVDLAIAWVAASVMQWPLWLATAVGFAIAAALNYFLHELWTFRHGKVQMSLGRALRYAAALILTLAVRIGTVALIVKVIGDSQTLLVLVFGFCASFAANFLFSKHFVFHTSTSPKDLV